MWLFKFIKLGACTSDVTIYILVADWHVSAGRHEKSGVRFIRAIYGSYKEHASAVSFIQAVQIYLDQV